MSTKPKRVVLRLSDKFKILIRLKKCTSGSSLVREFGVGNSTITDIKKFTEYITKFVCVLDGEDGSLHRKKMKTAENRGLDTAVYTWFMQVRGQALEMNQTLGGSDDFKASIAYFPKPPAPIVSDNRHSTVLTFTRQVVRQYI